MDPLDAWRGNDAPDRQGITETEHLTGYLAYWDELRQFIAQWREISPNYCGDFYPLTPWSRDDKAWIAWQFDHPDPGAGVVQTFRRQDSFYESARFKMRGLESKARYEVSNRDTPATRHTANGSELMELGLLVELPNQPAAAVITYRKIQ
jgi:alpha-galactosidase